MTAPVTDRIEKSIVLHAPRSRVWRALTDAGEFGQWFGARLTGPFVQGSHVSGHITHPGYEHLPFEATVEHVEPERLFSWRWHVMIDPESGRVSDATTLVTFELQDVDDGTLLTVVESGFDTLASEYRDAGYRGNESGWTQQMVAIERYLASAS